MIRKLKQTEIKGLNMLIPISWKYDYEKFLWDYFEEDFFHAFIMVHEGKLIGTGNTLLKDKVGWLANIIIDPKYRGNGYGFQMTKYLVDDLIKMGCKTQLLVATDLGKPVYEKIGFKSISEYQCFDSISEVDIEVSKSIRPLVNNDLQQVYQLDRDINDENRIHLIDRFYENGMGYFSKNNKLEGFYLPEFGRGLVLAKRKEVGSELVKLKHSKACKRTLVPVENIEGIKILENMGLIKGERSTRMVFGKQNNWSPTQVFSYGSGYCG